MNIIQSAGGIIEVKVIMVIFQFRLIWMSGDFR